jgi:hypothetical protein
VFLKKQLISNQNKTKPDAFEFDGKPQFDLHTHLVTPDWKGLHIARNFIVHIFSVIFPFSTLRYIFAA